MKYGYIRVSTKDQNIDRQLISIKSNGVLQENIYIDYLSGRDFNRPAYQKMIKKLKKEDILIIKSIDRLGRNYEEIIKQWTKITKIIQAQIYVLDFPLLDTRKTYEGLTVNFIADMVLQIMSYVAQIERENLLQRQKEGIQAAKIRGVVFGRKKLEKPENYKKQRELYQKGKISLRQGAKALGISHTTFNKWIKDEIDN